MIPILDGAVEAWEQKLRLTMERYPDDTIDGNHRALTEMLELLSQVPMQVGGGLAGNWKMRENVILGKLSHRLKISESHIRERLSELRIANQQKNGTNTTHTFHGHDAESPQPQTWTFPKNPNRDEIAERELLEIIFTLPEQAARIRQEFTPADLTIAALRQLLELCFQLQDEGVAASYDKVTSRLEDAGLKNLAADIDWHAREIKMSAETAEHTLRFFRDRRELREKEAAVLAGPHRASAVDGSTPNGPPRMGPIREKGLSLMPCGV